MDLLSPTSVKETNFTTGRGKGYNIDEVDQFKARVEFTVDLLTEQAATAREEKEHALRRAESMEKDVAPKVENPSEQAFRMLDAARETSEKVLAQANAEAELIRTEAEKYGVYIHARLDEEFHLAMDDLEKKREALEEQITKLDTFAGEAKAMLWESIAAQLSTLDNIRVGEIANFTHSASDEPEDTQGDGIEYDINVSVVTTLEQESEDDFNPSLKQMVNETASPDIIGQSASEHMERE